MLDLYQWILAPPIYRRIKVLELSKNRLALESYQRICTQFIEVAHLLNIRIIIIILVIIFSLY